MKILYLLILFTAAATAKAASLSIEGSLELSPNDMNKLFENRIINGVESNKEWFPYYGKTITEKEKKHDLDLSIRFSTNVLTHMIWNSFLSFPMQSKCWINFCVAVR